MHHVLPLTKGIATDIRTWHANIEQHASEGVNKILIGNKSDWTDKRAVTEEQGRQLAEELGIRFMETSAKVNEGVEEAFFTLARCVLIASGSVSAASASNTDHDGTKQQRHQDTLDRLTSRRIWHRSSRRLSGHRLCKGQPAGIADRWWMLLIIEYPLDFAYISSISVLACNAYILHVVCSLLPRLAPRRACTPALTYYSTNTRKFLFSSSRKEAARLYSMHISHALQTEIK